MDTLPDNQYWLTLLIAGGLSVGVLLSILDLGIRRLRAKTPKDSIVNARDLL